MRGDCRRTGSADRVGDPGLEPGTSSLSAHVVVRGCPAMSHDHGVWGDIAGHRPTPGVVRMLYAVRPCALEIPPEEDAWPGPLSRHTREHLDRTARYWAALEERRERQAPA